MPDIAKMVHARLVQPSKLTKSAHLSTAIGATILRQLSEVRDVTGGVRLSSSGACERNLAYTYHHENENGHSIDATSKIAFAIGDATEGFITAAVAEAFEGMPGMEVWNIGEEQETVTVEVQLDESRTALVPGHPDGSMRVPQQDGASGVDFVNAILEVKSMSDFAFKKFRKGGLESSDSYYWQVQAYMAAKGYDYAYVIAFGKATTAKEAYIDDDGSWWPLFPVSGQWIERDERCIQKIREKFKRVIKSNNPGEIERPYGPNKKGRLSFPCDYCKYYKTCFPNTEEVAEESKWLQKSTKIKVYVRNENDQ
tara:strand:- start:5656 stop:6588 length:933 start_codon:yes stop_codon:yes gene_type:complete